MSKRTKSPRDIDGLIISALLLIFTAGLSFWAVEVYTGSPWELKDLTHVTGRIVSERYIKHWVNGSKFQQEHYEPVLVLSIENSSEGFGFIEDYKEISRLESVRFADNNTIADIYYDKTGPRIEDGVTLHVFDLKIGDRNYVSIKEFQRTDLTMFGVVSGLAILSGWLSFVAIRRITKGYI